MCFSCTKTKPCFPFWGKNEKFSQLNFKKMKYSNEEREQIVKESFKSKDKVEIAIKYDIHYTSLYS